ncbi:MAG: TetR/AcrR family transcriptional regulator [Caldilineaceae bacterium]|nr:TetR/AcrR family transcriptional regulator [Caldilineaceae bacterium]
MARERGETRELLVEKAKQLFYQQGYRQTTLANIADAAQVPVGNIYYYFRTKEDLAKAVIENHVADLQALFGSCSALPDPRERLGAYIKSSLSIMDEVVHYGCPYGSLCAELEKEDGALAEAAAKLLNLPVEWATEQFLALGKGEKARELALDLVTAQQGTLLLTNTLRSPELLKSRVARLVHWVGQV